MFAYSPRKNRVKPIAEYSTLYPATNSASASGRSKGARFVSAKHEIKNKTSKGNNGTQNQIGCCANTTSVKFKDPTHKSTVIQIRPIETSYDTICAAERKLPKNPYFELLDHPAVIIPYTPSDEIANTYNNPT